VTLFEAGALLRPGVGSSIASAFRSSLEVLATSVSWLIYLVTFLVPWLLLATLLWWVAKRIKARRRAA
jgi:membrane protein DedA with SNARE-associated domain